MPPINYGKFYPYTYDPTPAPITCEPGPIVNWVIVGILAAAILDLAGTTTWAWYLVVWGIAYGLYRTFKPWSGPVQTPNKRHQGSPDACPR
jgi:hypothetical protein